MVNDSEVLDVLQRWAFRRNPDRKNVAPVGHDTVPSDIFGLVRTRTGQWQQANLSKAYPAIPKLLNRWLSDRLGSHPAVQAAWRCTSITVNGSFASKRHRDGRNTGPSIIRAFGADSGGELRIWPNDDRSTRADELTEDDSQDLVIDDPEHLTIYDGRRAHEVRPFTGQRFSVIFFVTSGSDRMQHGQLATELGTQGFRVPRSEADLTQFKAILSNNQAETDHIDGEIKQNTDPDAVEPKRSSTSVRVLPCFPTLAIAEPEPVSGTAGSADETPSTSTSRTPKS